MSIDWAATGVWMQAWAGFAGAGAVAFAAWKAGDAYQLWLRQQQSARRLEAAGRISSAVFKVADAFSMIRNPRHQGYELERARSTLRENLAEFGSFSDGKQRNLATAQVVLDRLAAHADLWKELYECLVLGRVFFGEQGFESLRGLFEARRKIEVSAQIYGTEELEPDFRRELQCDFWAGSQGDEVAPLVENAINFVRTEVLPILAAALPARAGG
jgi:hypothetical protein